MWILHMSREVATSWLAMSPAVLSRDSNHLRITAFVYVKCDLDASTSIMTHLGNPFVLNCLMVKLKTHVFDQQLYSLKKKHFYMFVQWIMLKFLRNDFLINIKHSEWNIYTFHRFGWGCQILWGLHGFYFGILVVPYRSLRHWKLRRPKLMSSPDF